MALAQKSSIHAKGKAKGVKTARVAALRRVRSTKAKSSGGMSKSLKTRVISQDPIPDEEMELLNAVFEAAGKAEIR